jgi:thioredoxin-related protein
LGCISIVFVVVVVVVVLVLRTSQTDKQKLVFLLSDFKTCHLTAKFIQLLIFMKSGCNYDILHVCVCRLEHFTSSVKFLLS